MVNYSSDQFFQDWRFAIDKDFVDSDGSSFQYADDGKQEWGDEIQKFTFAEKPQQSCVSSDGKTLAIAAGQDIHVFDTKTWKAVTVLKGHTSKVTSLAFKPNDANILASSEQGDWRRDGPPPEPMIILWRLDEAGRGGVPDDETLSRIGTAAVSTATDKFAELDIKLAEDEIEELRKAVTPAVARVARQHGAANLAVIKGSLITHFQSKIFSPSGKWIAYSPKKRGSLEANDISIYSIEDSQVEFTLKRHTDSIMWTGWSPDEAYFATVAWDQTVRIWDAKNEYSELYKFETEGQNWTGAFSRDSKFFASTCGQGSLQINSLKDGSTQWFFKPEKMSAWRRAMDWHPHSNLLIVGGDSQGELLLLDVEKQEIVQKRLLSTSASKPDNDAVLRFMGTWLGVTKVKFVDEGRKVAFWTSGDGSAEVYDLDRKVKWRFARGGTGDGPKSHEWRDENGKVTSKGGYEAVVWEDKEKEELMLASVDDDAVRIWSVKMSKT